MQSITVTTMTNKWIFDEQHDSDFANQFPIETITEEEAQTDN
jgi:hypothetical protein